MKLSVIIPTYNRWSALEKCLKAINCQDLEKNLFEVIVIDDESPIDYKESAEKLMKLFNINGKFLKQKKSGPASARNLGIKESSGDIILFIGDDMIPDKNLFKEHITNHEKNPEKNYAILGKAEWSKEINYNKFMFWLDSINGQFDFNSTKHNEQTDYHHFYTSNISLKKIFLIENGIFDERFPYAAVEDTELGYRLEKKGLKLFYNQNAIVSHYHQITFYSYLKRKEKIGESMAIFSDICKELQPSIIKNKKASKQLPIFLRDFFVFIFKIFKKNQAKYFFWKQTSMLFYAYGYWNKKRLIKNK